MTSMNEKTVYNWVGLQGGIIYTYIYIYPFGEIQTMQICGDFEDAPPPPKQTNPPPPVHKKCGDLERETDSNKQWPDNLRLLNDYIWSN